MKPLDLVEHAGKLVLKPSSAVSEVDCRRAISAAYYGLFHTLTDAAGELIAGPDNPDLANVVGRGVDHSAIKRVCRALDVAEGKPLPPPYLSLFPGPLSDELRTVINSFVALIDARHSADYDFNTVPEQAVAIAIFRRSWSALESWRIIHPSPETRVFLATIVLADRWTRRG